MTAKRPGPKPLRVLLVDDHVVVRAGIRMLIESHEGFTIVGEAADRATASSLAVQTQPDIILLDLDLGTESGLDLISHLLDEVSQARILVLTGVRDTGASLKAIRLGAMGVVPKEAASEVLIKAIRRVCAGEAWVDHSATAEMLAGMSTAAAQNPRTGNERIATLSPREREVIALIAEGLTNRRIAERLFISETTVRHHLTSIFGKLGVSDRLELLVYAYRHRLGSPDH